MKFSEVYNMTHRCIVTLVVGFCLAFACVPAYAANETEMTGGFVPVISDIGQESGSGSEQPNSQESGSGSEQPNSPESSDGSEQPNSPESSDGSEQPNSQESVSGSEQPSSQESAGGGNENAGNSADGGPSGSDSSGAGAGPSGSVPSSSETELSSDGSAAEDVHNSEAPQDGYATDGIKLDDGSIVTVDEDSQLILVNTDGNTRVLDDARRYTIETGSGTTVVIRDEEGNEVETEGATVRFTDAEGKQVVLDVSDGFERKSDAATASDGDETELSDETGQESTASQPSEAEGNVPIPLIVLAALVAVTAVIAGIVFWRRKKR